MIARMRISSHVAERLDTVVVSRSAEGQMRWAESYRLRW